MPSTPLRFFSGTAIKEVFLIFKMGIPSCPGGDSVITAL